MSIPKIGGREARKLLELPDSAASWKIEQRNLAETVAWLYDRLREIHNDQRCWADAYRAPIEWDPHSTDPARLARAEAHDDCADMLATLLDDEEARP